jgi:hypothetical protein
MRKRRHPVGFGKKSIAKARVFAQPGREHLDDVGAGQARVVCQVKHAHPTPGQLALDPPAGEDLAGPELHRWLIHASSVSQGDRL